MKRLSVYETLGYDPRTSSDIYRIKTNICNAFNLGYKVELDFYLIRNMPTQLAAELYSDLVNQYGDAFIQNNLRIISLNNQARDAMIQYFPYWITSTGS